MGRHCVWCRQTLSSYWCVKLDTSQAACSTTKWWHNDHYLYRIVFSQDKLSLFSVMEHVCIAYTKVEEDLSLLITQTHTDHTEYRCWVSDFTACSYGFVNCHLIQWDMIWYMYCEVSLYTHIPCNVVSHWPDACSKWSLALHQIVVIKVVF